MLLEVSCSVDHFMDFLSKAEAAGVFHDFSLRGADENSGFGVAAQEVADVDALIPEPTTESDMD